MSYNIIVVTDKIHSSRVLKNLSDVKHLLNKFAPKLGAKFGVYSALIMDFLVDGIYNTTSGQIFRL